MLLLREQGYPAPSDDLKKEALKQLTPGALEQCIEDMRMYRNVKEDTLSAAQVRSIINERICARRPEPDHQDGGERSAR